MISRKLQRDTAQQFFAYSAASVLADCDRLMGITVRSSRLERQMRDTCPAQFWRHVCFGRYGACTRQTTCSLAALRLVGAVGAVLDFRATNPMRQ